MPPQPLPENTQPAITSQQRRPWLVAGTLLQLACIFGGDWLAARLGSPVLSIVLGGLGIAAFGLCVMVASGIVQRSNLRLRLSDLFWLTLVVAVGIGWAVERAPLARELQAMEGYSPYLFVSTFTDPAAVQRAAILQELRSLTDDELRRRFAFAANWWGDDEFEGCLSELTRRRDIETLRQQHTRMYEKSLREFGGFETWPTLTALRRGEQRPDPLKVVVEVPRKPNARPLLIVTLQNVDVEAQPVVFKESGMQRHGREEQIRAYLTDEAGKLVPNSNLELVHSNTHGFSSRTSYSTRIQSGKTNAVPYIVDLRKYLAPPPTGRYQLHVVFSDSYIADEDNFDGYTLCRSEPLPVMVENRVQPARRSFAVYPVFVLLALAAIAVGVSFIQRLRRQADRPEPLRRLIDWRAVVALAVGFMLAWGWLCNVHDLADEIDRFRPHDEADWSIMLAE